MELAHQLLLKMELKPFLVHVINIGVTNFSDASSVNRMDRFVAHQTAAAKRTPDQRAPDNSGGSGPKRRASSPVSLPWEMPGDGDTFACPLCGDVFPRFFEEPHRLFHDAQAAEAAAGQS